MKNFPHQINDLNKLTAALGAANVLIGAGGQFGDDGVFGSALAHAGIYTFRDKTISVAENLELEQQKPVGNQGFRTAARDIRRFFILANLISPTFQVTTRGRDLLDAAPNISFRNALWRDALLQLALIDTEGNISHPYRILLRLIADRPGIETSKLLLALEARNDSPGEYARILELAGEALPDIIEEIGIGEANARNATKILPAIAEQVGDIARDNNRTYLRSHRAATEDSILEPESIDYEKSEPQQPTAVNPEDISPLPNFGEGGGVNVDLSAAVEIRKRRTIEHHNAVVSIAMILGQTGFTIYERPYDCLGFKEHAGSILLEIKTLDGTRTDERRQTEKALGQLRGYRFFNIPAAMKAPKLIEAVAYTSKPSEDSVHFMRDNAVFSVWRDNNGWRSVDLDGNNANFSADALLAG